MAEKSMFSNGPGPVAPLPSPQVVLTLIDNQVQLQTNITPGPQTWRVIAQMCLQGGMAALNKLSGQLGQKEEPRIVVPPPQENGGFRW